MSRASRPSRISSPRASMLEQPPTPSERARGAAGRLRPTRPMLVDAAFTTVLVGLALVGFRTTFFGWGWLWVGLAGLALGLVVSHVTAAFRLPGIVTALAGAATYVLLGPLVAGGLPSPSAMAEAARTAVAGWKELLTALPPVDAQGRYLLLPFLFALVGAATTYAVTRRWRGIVGALVAPVTLLVASILLGTLTPAAVALQGAAFGLGAIGWAAVRSNRNRPALQNGAGRGARAVTTAALLAAATVGGFFVGPHLPGADETRRTVLRTALEPPFDVSQFPSPLAGFRRYTEPNASELFDRTLLQVEGLPAGTPVRFATLDSYDGLAWGAGNAANLGEYDEGTSFRRVGSHLPTTSTGEPASVTVRVPAGGYDEVWLPTVGTVSGIDFGGGRGDDLAEELRFNLDTSTGVLPTRLAPGDEYTLTTFVDPPAAALPPAVDTDSGALVDTQALTFLDDRVDQWSGREDGSWQKVVAIARAMRSGAYTDGGVPGDYQNIFLPGHGLRRMTQFVKSTQLAGNDEQYASALALAANRLGVPARVVLGAVPDAAGVVKGKDVHAWVELRTTTGSWQPVLPQHFVPDRNKKPEQLIQKSEEKRVGAQVPPPAANNPPSVLQGPDQAQNATQLRNPPKPDDNPLDPSTWPDWLRLLVLVVGLPLLVLLATYGGIRIAKALRSRRRRTSGPTHARISGGWRDLVDSARDLRVPVPAHATRLEQARAVERHLAGPDPEPESVVVDGALVGAPRRAARAESASVRTVAVVPLAASADSHVFDVHEPTAEQVEAYWADVATARTALRGDRSWWERIRADVSLATFRDPAREDGRMPSGSAPRHTRGSSVGGTGRTPHGLRKGRS